MIKGVVYASLCKSPDLMDQWYSHIDTGDVQLEDGEYCVIPVGKVLIPSPTLDSQKVFNAWMVAVRQFSLDGKKVKVLVVEE